MKQQTFSEKAFLSLSPESLGSNNSKKRATPAIECPSRLPVSLSTKNLINVNLESNDANYRRQDWGEIPDVSGFSGRSEELSDLQQWLVKDRSRLVMLNGMGGIGKTTLAAKLCQQIESEFDLIIWRSLRNAPSIESILTEVIQFLSLSDRDCIPPGLEAKILVLLDCLRTRRCLLILDDLDSVLEVGERVGSYRQGYEGYGQLLRCFSTTEHQSCLLITSQEKPRGLEYQIGENFPIRSLVLKGLSVRESQYLLSMIGVFSGTESDWQYLVDYHGGNPLFLKLVAIRIRDLFDCNLSFFLKMQKDKMLIFPELRYFLDRQFNRLSDLEKEIMYRLAMESTSLRIDELHSQMCLCGTEDKSLEALGNLLQRSLSIKLN